MRVVPRQDGAPPGRGARSEDESGPPLDWLIVGGGIHGAHLAVRLLDEGEVAPERLAIVDPAPRLLHRWWACAEATGMQYLRSPAVHHLDTHPYALHRFAGRRRDRVPGLFAPPYERPSLSLFRSHCDHVIERFGLAARHVRGRAVACAIEEDGVAVRLASGEELRAERLVLAIGASEQPDWPDWAPRGHPRVRHLFATGRGGAPMPEGGTVAVVGGGISAVQVALRLARNGRRVELVSRHALRERQFDSDPGWLGPKHMRAFERTTDLVHRRAIVDEARHRGSVPPDDRLALRAATGRGAITWRESEVEALADEGDGLFLRLRDGDSLRVDDVLLATGFSLERPGGPMVDELVESAALPCAPCGYPAVDRALRWHPRVHVTGPLAELEIGPVSRTIAGARRAGDRILTALGRRRDVAALSAP